MISDLYPCGFVVQSSEPSRVLTIHEESESSHNGIGRYLTWPLDYVQNDPIADQFWKEALHCWFCYRDERVWSVPDKDYITRYVDYCESLGIKTRVLSLWSVLDFSIEIERDESQSRFLGFDYSGGDLDGSVLFFDLFDMIEDEVTYRFTGARRVLNENGLFSNIEDAKQYVELRTKLEKEYDLEDMYEPQILGLYLVKDFSQSLDDSNI